MSAKRGWTTPPISRGARRAFWERFAARALTEPNRTPSEADRIALIAGIKADAAPHRGSVVLVGVGPGDPSCSR